MYSWRSIENSTLENLVLRITSDGIRAESVIQHPDYMLSTRWLLNPEWQFVSADMIRTDSAGKKTCSISVQDGNWIVNGVKRPDLKDASFPDVSATPFCNTLPIFQMEKTGQTLFALTTAYIDSDTLTVRLSQQQYEKTSPRRYRYTDLGVAAGFTAILTVDADGMVMNYEGLFTRV